MMQVHWSDANYFATLNSPARGVNEKVSLNIAVSA